MRISIITICFHDKPGFIRTANSIVKQTFEDYEWIVIDGGSTDGTVDEIVRYANNITYWVSEPDNGIYCAMNKGTRQATGDYCLYLNSGDCFCSAKSLERVTSVKWNADVVTCDMFFDNGTRFMPLRHSPDIINYSLFLQGSLFHQASFIKNDVAKANPYDENYQIVSDCKFWFCVLVIMNHSFQHIKIPLSVFDTNGISSTMNSRHIEERKRMLCDFFSEKVGDRVIADTNVLRLVDVMTVPFFAKKCVKECIKCSIRFEKYIASSVRDIYFNIKYRERL